MAAVLDSSAVLAMLFKESGAELVASKISDAAISTVNLAEVVSKLIDEGFTPAEARRTAQSIPMQVHLLDTESAIRTGLLRATTRAHGLSLGDRACLALAGTPRNRGHHGRSGVEQSGCRRGHPPDPLKNAGRRKRRPCGFTA